MADATAATVQENPQAEAIRFLSLPATFADGTARVDLAETHISYLFLGKGRVFKLKRQVRYPYLDFSTVDARRAACEAEVRINRRTAPGLYLGVRALVRGKDGGLELGDGDAGEIVDWVVEMARFDEASLLDRQAGTGGLDRRLMERLADEIAAFHLAAERKPGDDGHTSFARTIDGNAETFETYGPGVLDMEKVRAMIAGQRQALAGALPVLDRRARGGFIRHCHGDLHLGNIFLDASGQPVLFDAIEFNTLFAEIDVLYDLSFLLMDLDHRGWRRLAAVLMNRYLDATGDGGEALSLFPLLLSLRAGIRAHVNATAAARHSDKAEAARLGAEAGKYLEHALGYLARPGPRLIATGGLSGSGKSRLARELACFVGAAPGARVVRSDSIRKRLAGVGLLTRLPPESYTPDMNARTYDAVMADARSALSAGHSMIADAVFAREDERARIETVARDAGVPFTGIWLEADAETMVRRAETRTRNVSDAGAAVVQKQLTYTLGAIAWTRVDSSGSRDDTLQKGRAAAGV